MIRPIEIEYIIDYNDFDYRLYHTLHMLYIHL